MASGPSFTEIPILPLSHAFSPHLKPAFLENLRYALLNVGFLYLSETNIPESLTSQVIAQCHAFFETLPKDEKLRIEMKNEKSFLGYSRLDNEITAGSPDHREQLDLATPDKLPAPFSPAWENLWGPNQWPDPAHLPQFRPVMEEYMARMSSLSINFTSLIAQALEMDANAFAKFFDDRQTHKMKLVKYPHTSDKGQGVGPHKDSMLSSYLLQGSEHKGLQAQNTSGQWIDCDPKDGTFVVAIGQGLEAITGGVCTSTTHRVLSPRDSPRYSIPFFQGVSFDAKFESMDVPENVKELKRQILEKSGGRQDDVEFTFVKGKWRNLGEATLMNRVKSHTDVSERWYPDLLAKVREQQAKEPSSNTDRSGPQNNPRMTVQKIGTAVEAH